MSYKPRVDVIAAILSDVGWTCEYHEPDSKCTVCQRLHNITAERILIALGIDPPEETDA